MDELYNELIEELNRKIHSAKKKYTEKLNIRLAYLKISDLYNQFQIQLRNSEELSKYPEVNFDSSDFEKWKNAFDIVGINITDAEMIGLFTSFKKMNYFNSADEKMIPVIRELVDYKNSYNYIKSFFESFQIPIENFIVNKSVSEASVMEEAKYLEQLTSTREMLGEHGFTETMSKEKLEKIFSTIDKMLYVTEKTPNRLADQYKLLIVYKALLQDKALHKVSVKRIDKPIEEIKEKTIEEEQQEAKIVVEKDPEVEEEKFTIDDYIAMLPIDFYDEESKNNFFNAFEEILNDKGKLDEMLSFAREFCKKQEVEMKKYKLPIDNYHDRKELLTKMFNTEDLGNYDGNYDDFKTALLVMQELSELSDNSEDDTLSILSLLAILYDKDLIDLNDGINYVNEDEEKQVEVLEEVVEEAFNPFTKPIFILDPDVFENSVSSTNMELRDRKKIASIMRDLIEDTNLGSRHPYSDRLATSAAVLKKYGVMVAKKGGKTRTYFAPIKNDNNEVVANIVILPCVTSKDKKYHTNEEVDTARMLENNSARFNKLKEMILHDVDSPLLDKEKEIANKLIKKLTGGISKDKTHEGGVIR